MGIPITAIALGTTGGGTAGIVAMLISWAGIAAVNLVHARRH
jgi:NCAIR mutase (PurE)-related protein